MAGIGRACRKPITPVIVILVFVWLPCVAYGWGGIESLPDPLICYDGTPVTDAGGWYETRRPEILSTFESSVYGECGYHDAETTVLAVSRESSALSGTADRIEVILAAAHGDLQVDITLLIYVPALSAEPVPVFLGLNYWGNHSVVDDPGISVIDCWARNSLALDVKNHEISDVARGACSDEWPIELLLSRGYAVATAYYGDIAPDNRRLYEESLLFADDCGALGLWAWGLSRCVDYLQTDDQFDGTKISVFGHSRLGKTALWAGAQDQRIDLVIANQSGCMGAAISRRRIGETPALIHIAFPYWFSRHFGEYAYAIRRLPVDQHMLIGLIAPRPVYISSARGDYWSDPKGEFLGAYCARTVYELLGAEGISESEWPKCCQPVFTTVGYHIRQGRHNVAGYDWECFIDFADLHFGAEKR